MVYRNLVVPKKLGEVRIYIDLKPLNESVLREPYPITLFSKLDANSGFWQILLSKESRQLTTFITPFGRFHFNKPWYFLVSTSTGMHTQVNVCLHNACTHSLLVVIVRI